MTELDLDLYGDLDNFKWERDIKEKDDELKKLQEKYDCAIKTIETLQSDIKTWKKKCANIEKSFWSLLETSKAEIKRKDTQLDAFRREKDDIVFRRTNPRQVIQKEHSVHENRCSDLQIKIPNNNNPFRSDHQPDISSLNLKITSSVVNKTSSTVQSDYAKGNKNYQNETRERITYDSHSIDKTNTNDGKERLFEYDHRNENTYPYRIISETNKQGRDDTNAEKNETNATLPNVRTVQTAKANLNFENYENPKETERRSESHKNINKYEIFKDQPATKDIFSTAPVTDAKSLVEQSENATKKIDEVTASASLVSELMSDVKKLKQKSKKNTETVAVPTTTNDKKSFEDAFFDDVFETLNVSNSKLPTDEKTTEDSTTKNNSGPLTNWKIHELDINKPAVERFVSKTFSNCDQLKSPDSFSLKTGDENLSEQIPICSFKDGNLVKSAPEFCSTDNDIEQILNCLHSVPNQKDLINNEVLEILKETSAKSLNSTNELLKNDQSSIQLPAIKSCDKIIPETTESHSKPISNVKTTASSVKNKKRKSSNMIGKTTKLSGNKIEINGLKNRKCIKNGREATSKMKKALCEDITEQLIASPVESLETITNIKELSSVDEAVHVEEIVNDQEIDVNVNSAQNISASTSDACKPVRESIIASDISPNQLETIAATTFLTDNLLVTPVKGSPLKVKMKILFGDTPESRYSILRSPINEGHAIENVNAENQENNNSLHVDESIFEEIETPQSINEQDKNILTKLLEPNLEFTEELPDSASVDCPNIITVGTILDIVDEHLHEAKSLEDSDAQAINYQTTDINLAQTDSVDNLEEGEIMVQEILNDLRRDEFLSDAIEQQEENSLIDKSDIRKSSKKRTIYFEQSRSSGKKKIKKTSLIPGTKCKSKSAKSTNKLENVRKLQYASRSTEESEYGDIADDETSDKDQLEKYALKAAEMLAIKSADKLTDNARSIKVDKRMQLSAKKISEELVKKYKRKAEISPTKSNKMKNKKRKVEEPIPDIVEWQQESIEEPVIAEMEEPVIAEMEEPKRTDICPDLVPTIYLTKKRSKKSTRSSKYRSDTSEIQTSNEGNIIENPEITDEHKEATISDSPPPPELRCEKQTDYTMYPTVNEGPKANFRNFVIPKLNNKHKNGDEHSTENRKNKMIQICESPVNANKVKENNTTELPAPQINTVLSKEKSNSNCDANSCLPKKTSKPNTIALNNQDEELFDDTFKSPLQRCNSLQTSFEQENMSANETSIFIQLEEDFRKIFGKSPQHSSTSPLVTRDDKPISKTDEAEQSSLILSKSPQALPSSAKDTVVHSDDVVVQPNVLSAKSPQHTSTLSLTETEKAVPTTEAVEQLNMSTPENQDTRNNETLANASLEHATNADNSETSSSQINNSSLNNSTVILKKFSTSSGDYEFKYSPEGIPTWVITRKRRKKINK